MKSLENKYLTALFALFGIIIGFILSVFATVFVKGMDVFPVMFGTFIACLIVRNYYLFVGLSISIIYMIFQYMLSNHYLFEDYRLSGFIIIAKTTIIAGIFTGFVTQQLHKYQKK